MSHYYYIHRIKATGKYMNAPHVGHRLFYTKADAKAYLDSDNMEIVPVHLVPAEAKTIERKAK